MEQARELAELVAGEGLRALYASDMLRARMTAEIVGERIGLEPVIEPRVRECAWGAWEGMLVEEIAREEPEHWQAWLRAGKLFAVQSHSLTRTHHWQCGPCRSLSWRQCLSFEIGGNGGVA